MKDNFRNFLLYAFNKMSYVPSQSKEQTHITRDQTEMKIEKRELVKTNDFKITKI